tara:strand:- start:628 stop:1662 length:1035 start_codon:yes stop_codon:yes gene_type:complete
MAEEQTNLVEETTQETPQETQTETPVESTEEKKFDPLAFATDQMMEQFQGKYNEEAADKAEETTEQVERTKNADNFSWDNIEVEKQEEAVQESDEDWDAPAEAQPSTQDESVEESGKIDWARVSKELGISANGKEEIIKALNSPFIEQPKNEMLDKLNSYLSYNDRELIGAEMKTDGMEDFEIEEAIDKMEDSGVLKREAYRIRRQLNNAIEQEKQKFLKEKQQEELTNKEKVERNKKELQGHLKSLQTFMGGTVTKGQAQEAYKYITSGKMAEDIWKSHDNASEVAMFMLFKDKFAKILRSQGLEDGKAKILNEITSPSLSSKTRPTTATKSSGFDPAAFMRE